MRVQPRLHEAVNEEWISDKTRYAVDGLKRQRLDVPMLRKDGVLTPVTWREALAAAADALGGLAPSEIGVLAGPLADVEAMVCAKVRLKKGCLCDAGMGGRVDGRAGAV
jgi:NADH-quinone oxidoreductase subunit G